MSRQLPKIVQEPGNVEGTHAESKIFPCIMIDKNSNVAFTVNGVDYVG